MDAFNITLGLMGASCALALCSVKLANECDLTARLRPATQEPFLFPGARVPISCFLNSCQGGGGSDQGVKVMSSHSARPSRKINFRRIQERVYKDAVEVFDACKGDETMGLSLQLGLLSRHPGHRETIRRAFAECFQATDKA